MAIDSKVPRSRRAILGAAAGAAAATVINALDRPTAVRAGSDGDVALGQDNVAVSTTGISAEMSDFVLTVSNIDLSGRGLRVAANGTAIEATTDGPPGTALRATAGFEETWGTAIEAVGWVDIDGPVHMSRSGRAIVPAGRSYVDVDLRPKGGLPSFPGWRPLCFANVMSYRPGVFVAVVRPNYPVQGEARIYLSKVTPSDTYVAWLVLN